MRILIVSVLLFLLIFSSRCIDTSKFLPEKYGRFVGAPYSYSNKEEDCLFTTLLLYTSRENQSSSNGDFLILYELCRSSPDE